jgi:hypothetical protein
VRKKENSALIFFPAKNVRMVGLGGGAIYVSLFFSSPPSN